MTTGQPEIRDTFGTQTIRVLIIGTSNAPEETALQPALPFSRSTLPQEGTQATMVTGVPSYPRWQIYAHYHSVLRTQELRNGVDVRRMRNYVPTQQWNPRSAP